MNEFAFNELMITERDFQLTIDLGVAKRHIQYILSRHRVLFESVNQ